MKHLFASVIVICSSLSAIWTQDITVLPMYGGVETPEMRKAHDEYIASMLEAYKTRDVAAKMAVRIAWQELDKKDWKTAMRRFNQAWLLDSSKGEVFWGFGVTQAYAGNFEEAEAYFEKARLTLSDNARFLSDFGLYYLYRANNAAKPRIGFFLDYIFRPEYDPKIKSAVIELVGKSLVLTEEASKVDPKLARNYQTWAQALYARGDYKEAWQKAIQAESLGDKLTPSFEKALNKKLKRPNK